ncbi:glutathione S-transferase [Xylariomycetidae sp. FL0641]|nr:glutathione S-transferase [Xylariomycetidae sp. FL0641]
MAEEGKPTLQHLNNSQSQTILWLLEELEIPYHINYFERVEHRAPASLKATHPLGKSPQLITASGDRVLMERSAIAAYLIATYDGAGRFRARPGADARGDALREQELVGFGEASLNAMATVALLLTFLRRGVPFLVRPLVAAVAYMVRAGFLDAELDAQMRFLDGQLEGRQFFLGGPDPTRADFVNLFFVQMGHAAGTLDLAKYPHVNAWRERCEARPAWKRALNKGNGYSLKF